MIGKVAVKGLAALAAAVVLMGMLELSSIASERRAARAVRDAPLTDAVERALPSAPEVDDGEAARSPALTF